MIPGMLPEPQGPSSPSAPYSTACPAQFPSSPSAPYSVARHRVQRQLEVAAEASDPDVLVRRLTHAIKTASNVGIEDLAMYQEGLEAVQNQSSLAQTDAASQWVPSLMPLGIAPPPNFITPRRLSATPASVRARIDAGEVASLVAILTLTENGVAELRDASAPAGGVTHQTRVFDPSQVVPGKAHWAVRRGFNVFDHLALRDLLEDPVLPYARVVAVIDPLYPGSQILASQLLRHGPQGPLNSVVCVLPGSGTAQDMAGPEYLPIVAALCLGGGELGAGQGALGFAFGRALAIVERGSAYEGNWPESVAGVALQAASRGTEVEERPTGTGQWLFYPPAPEVVEDEAATPSPAPTAGEGEEGEEGGAAEAPPAEAAPEGEDGEETEKPPEPEKASYTGAQVHAWLFNGLNQCYASNSTIERLCSDGVLEEEARGCKDWLAKVEKSGFWGPVAGVRAETVRLREEERLAREEAKREAKRQAKAEKKRLAEEAAAAEAAAVAAAEAAAAAEVEAALAAEKEAAEAAERAAAAEVEAALAAEAAAAESEASAAAEAEAAAE